MEEFGDMMDTLAMQPQHKGNSGKTDDQPVNLALKTSEFSAQLRNKNNSIGAAYHSEQGMRHSQEDRCCLITDAFEFKKSIAADGIAGQEAAVISTEDAKALHKMTVACLFDGHSGSMCSEYMSKNFAKMLIAHENILDKSTDSALLDVCRQIDGDVCDYLLEDDDTSGSTGIIVIFIFLLLPFLADTHFSCGVKHKLKFY
jgi:hypothetical protein